MLKGRALPTIRRLPSQPSSLIGRDEELDNIAARLGDPDLRWLTLTGPPGVGKSRLAVAAAERVTRGFTDGVFFVDLAPVGAAEHVMARVALALGAAEPELLARQIGNRRALLVVDSMEHVAGAAVEMGTLLSECPHLKLLVTSRQSLHVSWEHVLRIDPLRLPDSVALFLARVGAAAGGHAPSVAESPAISQICERLDGLPLALELAAARVRPLSLESVLQRVLANRLDALDRAQRDTHHRHASMRAAIDWSYDQLPLSEQELFQMLSVFEGNCSLSAIAAVSGRESCEDTLAALVHHNLVCVVQDGRQVRYRLLETLRAYASERLRASPAWSSVQRRHAAYFQAFVEQLAAGLDDTRHAHTVDTFERDHANIVAALQWLSPEDALRITTALGSFWLSTGRVAEAAGWLESALARYPVEPSPPRAQAVLLDGDFALWRGDSPVARRKFSEASAMSVQLADAHTEALALARLGNLAHWQGDLPAARRLLSAAHHMFDKLGETRNLSFALCDLAGVACDEGSFVEAVHRAKQALVRFRSLDDSSGVAAALTRLGQAAYAGFDLRQALALFEESLRLRRELSDAHLVAQSLRHVATTAVASGERFRATDALREALPLFLRVQHALDIALTLQLCGELAIGTGELRSGVRVCSASAAQLLRLECSASAVDQVWTDRALNIGRSRLGRRAFDTEWTLGQAMSWNAAIDLAQALLGATASSGKLSGREREVAALIASGLSNRQVADDLAISERTVEVHVSNALRKLDLQSRTQLALWAKSAQAPAAGAAASRPARRSGGHSLASPRARGRPARIAGPRNTAN